MKMLVFLLLSFPLLAFCFAAVAELRSDAKLTKKLSNLIPVVLGIAAFGFSLYPRGLGQIGLASVAVDRVMIMLSAAIASSGALRAYSRRSTSVLVAVGGLELVFLWMFFGDVKI